MSCAVSRESSSATPGFKGRPDVRGTVELGYSLLPSFQGLGFGTELVRALTSWAFSHRAVERVMADTYPEFVASVRVLEKNRFTLSGRADEPGAVRYELRRSMFESVRQ
jgi:RimJ/RimL family protein N-acetyltransferase